MAAAVQLLAAVSLDLMAAAVQLLAAVAAAGFLPRARLALLATFRAAKLAGCLNLKAAQVVAAAVQLLTSVSLVLMAAAVQLLAAVSLDLMAAAVQLLAAVAAAGFLRRARLGLLATFRAALLNGFLKLKAAQPMAAAVRMLPAVPVPLIPLLAEV